MQYINLYQHNRFKDFYKIFLFSLQGITKTFNMTQKYNKIVLKLDQLNRNIVVFTEYL